MSGTHRPDSRKLTISLQMSGTTVRNPSDSANIHFVSLQEATFILEKGYSVFLNSAARSFFILFHRLSHFRCNQQRTWCDSRVHETAGTRTVRRFSSYRRRLLCGIDRSVRSAAMYRCASFACRQEHLLQRCSLYPLTSSMSFHGIT